MKNLFFISFILITHFSNTILSAQSPFNGKAVELTPRIYPDLRLTLDVNGSEKKLILKTKNSTNQPDVWQKFHFEHMRTDPDQFGVYSISTTDKDNKKVYLVKNNNYVTVESNPSTGWKLYHVKGWKIMTENRAECLSFNSYKDGTIISFDQCDEFPGIENPPPGEPNYHDSMEFKAIEK